MLVDDLQRGLRSAGFALDDKPFKAHLTLARFKVPQDVGRLQEPPAASTFEVRHLVLYRSLQTPLGSRYLPMGVIPLERL
jgi:2'-5' RNA ligase